MSDAWLLLATVVLLAANAFFVAAEFALVSARRASIEPLAEAGSRRAATTLRAMERVSTMMAGAQLGITVCSVALGYLSEPTIAHLLEPVLGFARVPEVLLDPVAFTVALAVVTVLHVVLGEVVPKNVTLAGPDRAALWLAPPLSALVVVLRPLIAVVTWVANRVLLAAGVTPREEVASAFTREEVADLVEQSHREGLLEDDARELLTGALSLDQRTAAAVLIPRAAVHTVPRTASPAQVEQEAAATGFSRFPVVGEDGDLAGYLHLKDVLETDAGRRREPVHAKWVRPLPRVGVQDTLRVVLARLQSTGAHLARATDEAGTTVGVVAMEDVLAALVGQIRDEARGGRAG